MPKWLLPLLGGLCMVGGLALMVFGALPEPAIPVVAPTSTPSLVPTATLRPTATPEPIVPTRTPAPSPTPTTALTVTPEVLARTATASPTSAVPSVTPLPASASTPTVVPALPTTVVSPSPTTVVVPSPTALPRVDGFYVPAHERFRIGVSLPANAAHPHNLGPLAVGWVMDWSVRTSTALSPDVMYAQTVRMMRGVLSPDAATLTAVAAARPGATWLISNEADVRWQDNVDATTYARLYQEAYTAIKAGDASAVVVAGGISQPTPLRLRYLDLVLEAYRAAYQAPLPSQAWHIHNYMLREERNSWGVDIPPGMPDNTGKLYSVEDSGNLDAFRAQIYDFRRWMVSRGYGGQPLLVTEFGVMMPADYGFPPERVIGFLRETWRFFLTASDASLGDPGDGGRLVQRWCWFSMNYGPYPTGDLIDSAGNWTPLAQAWIAYVRD